MFSQRFFKLVLLLFITLGGCASDNCPQGNLLIGLVNYNLNQHSLSDSENLKNYLAQQTCTFVQIEPAYNQLTAAEQIEKQNWSMVFAPPGIAAIALSQKQYYPIFQLQGLENERSVIVVKEDSPLQTIQDLANHRVALGEPGSATGYFLPLYDLYGLTLSEVRLAPTPKTVLEWISQNQVDAGALSETEFQQYRGSFTSTKFRIIHKTRFVPPGLVLLNSNLNKQLAQKIITAMKDAPPTIIDDGSYLPNNKIPDYSQLLIFVEKVTPLTKQLQEKPAVLIQN